MKKENLITIAIAAVTFVFGIVCYFLLPDTVVVQWSFSGEASNTMPKLLAVLVSYALTAVCLISARRKERQRSQLFGLLGLVLQIVMLVTN